MESDGNMRIRENMDELVNTIDCCPLFPLFRLKKIFSRRNVDEIQQYNDKKRINFAVLTNVCRRSTSIFNSFVDILWMSGQRDAARILKPEASAMRLLPSTSMSSYTFSPRVDRDVHYKMTSYPRGYCVIINNRDFESEDEIRKLSELDAANLRKAFTYLGYDVHLHENLTHTEMTRVLNDYSERDDLENHDSIAIVVMTHGNDRLLRAIDGGYVTEDEITSPFAAHNCSALKNKPKMFFIQACRGEKDDEGVFRQEHDNDDDDNSRFVQTTSVCDAQPFSNSSGRRRSTSLYDPSHGDMLISYATISGYRAYRTVEAHHTSYLGSWYVKALYLNLVQFAHEKELTAILDEVYREVSQMETEDGYKQATTYENRGFHKRLYFNPGYYE